MQGETNFNNLDETLSLPELVFGFNLFIIEFTSCESTGLRNMECGHKVGNLSVNFDFLFGIVFCTFFAIFVKYSLKASAI